MNWEIREAKYGDIVRVKAGDIYHYGIYVSEKEIVQFGLSPFCNTCAMRDIAVCTSDVDKFLNGGFMEAEMPDRREKKKRRTPDETVNAARARIGEKGYDILCNNCEHFVFECAYGRRHSDQSDEFFRTNPLQFAHVYVRKIPFETEKGSIYPTSRKKEIRACKNKELAKEKLYAWKLLEYALNHALELDIRKLKIKKEGTKWVCPECFFSISHTDGLVAVAVSMKNIGVDIEKRDIARFEKLDIDMMLHESEKSAFSSLDASKRAEKACKLWTLKEASYKHGGVGAFEPSTIDTNKKPSAVRKVRSNGNDYIIGIVGDDFLKVRVNAFDGIEISDKH